jgi:signal transduction histidine kinase/CheY-like chemotaxis protein
VTIASFTRLITARKRAEEELAVVTRLYAVLSRVNEAIVRTRDERSLYGEVCRIVAEDGAFPLVYVGLIEGRRIKPAACWGRAADYLRDIVVEVDGELGQGPTGTCVREDRPVVNEDFETNPSTLPWRERVLGHGLRASAAFPLHRRRTVVGALTLYAAEPGAFTAEHTKLLGALCADLSYALDALEEERLRSEAERALRESERSLREADRRKDEFLGILSHELRNPLAPIRNSVHILERADPTSEQAARARAVVRRQSEHLNRLVDDLLDVTRISRGKVELERSRFDLREIVGRACDDQRTLFEGRGIELRVEMSARPVWIEADETRIVQVVGNLLQNAFKFSSEGGLVTASVFTGGQAGIRVQDGGEGISPDFLPHVFEPFVQADGGLARTKGGLGLGLALVKGLVELHGGTVSARSAGPGRGSEFMVTLPMAPAGAPSPAAAPSVSAAAQGHEILVIEDNLDAAQSIAEVLELEGHHVHVATDGLSGIAKARELRPEVILCDIGLPDVDGYEVARRLRADEGLRSIRLIALSGYAQAEDRRRAKASGFDAHIAKPPSLDALLAAVAAPAHEASD